MPDLFKTEEKPITNDDKIRLGSELAKLEIELKSKKDEKRKVNSNYRVAINKLEEACESVSTQLDTGKVQFKYAVEEVPDDGHQTISIIRTDTREQVDVRPMNEQEKEASRKRRQPELFEEGGGKGKGKVTSIKSAKKPKKNGKG